MAVIQCEGHEFLMGWFIRGIIRNNFNLLLRSPQISRAGDRGQVLSRELGTGKAVFEFQTGPDRTVFTEG